MREADTSHPGRSDVVGCGPGLDRIEKDSRDRARNCEIVL
jgi:hypothetical protein